MGLEDFVGFDQGEGMDAAAFERFQERMKRAAAQIKAIKKEEKKRKKKEDELIKILLRFIQHSKKRDLVLVISRALEQNLPANYILSIVILGNEDIQKEVGQYLMLNAPKGALDNESALTFFREDKTLPLKVRIEIDQWIKGLMYQASENPQKLLRYAYDVEEVEVETSNDEDTDAPEEETQFFGEKQTKKVKVISERLIQLTAHVIFDFLGQNDIEEDMSKLKEFSEFLQKGILKKTDEDLNSRKELGGGPTGE
jgi:hypothetical protein